jgi:hypothetical protein
MKAAAAEQAAALASREQVGGHVGTGVQVATWLFVWCEQVDALR